MITMKLPPLETRKVWIGAYGGHSDVIVVFCEKPEHPADWMFLRKEKILATISTGDWEKWFDLQPLIDAEILREDGRPFAVEVPRFIEMEITAAWDDFGIAGLDTEVDR